MTDYGFIQDALRRHFTPEQLYDNVFDKKTRTALAALDFEFFCRYYLAHHFDQPPALFHRTLFSDVEDMMEAEEGRNYLGVVLRGGAKTTIFTLALPLWCICLRKRHFIVIISDSERMAKEKAIAVKDELQSNERLRTDFGDLVGSRWAETEYETANRIKVLALGSGMNLRGSKHYQFRPDLIILDDIESRDEVGSPAMRRKLSSWFKSDVLKAGQPNTKIVVIGTYLSYDCVLKEMEESPVFWRRRNFPALKPRDDDFAYAFNTDLWDEWASIMTNLSNKTREEDAKRYYLENEQAMLYGAEPTWPERLSYYLLMTYRLAGRTEFNIEYLNEPSDIESRYFTKYGFYKKFTIWNNTPGAWLVPWDKNGPTGRPASNLNECVLFAATDPSMGASTQSDFSAIIIIAHDPKTGFRFVLEADIQRRPPSKIMEAQIEWMKRYPSILRWTIETVQMQAFFKEQSALQALEQGPGLPLVDYKGGATSKHIRIQSLQMPLENGYLMLDIDGQDLLKQQLDHYQHTEHDDGPDCLEMVYSISLDYTPQSGSSVTEGQAYQFGEGDVVIAESYDPYAEADLLYERREKMEKHQREDDKNIFMIVV